MDDALAAVRSRDDRIALLTEDVGNLERELRGKRSVIRRLRAEQDQQMRDDPLAAKAQTVLSYWRAKIQPKARELGGKRLEHVIARLKGGYTVEDLQRCVDGYALKPFVVNGKRAATGGKDQWYADAELIFRDAGKVDAGIRIAERADDLRQVLAEGGKTEMTDIPVVETLSRLGEAALRFAKFGWMVFPCQEGGKAPATSNGLLGAKRDEESIRAWWSRHPAHNVAVRTGQESGVVVLDIDGDEGWDNLHRLEDLHGELPETASVTTPRGGQHFYFQWPGVEVRNTAGYPAEGIDFRGDGGYVLAPGSVGPGGRKYEPDDQVAIAEMPAWLLGLLVDRQDRERTSIGPARDWGKFISDGAGQGERDSRMTSYVGHLFSHGHSAGEVLEAAKVLNAAKVKPPLPERDLTRIVSSIARARVRRSS